MTVDAARDKRSNIRRQLRQGRGSSVRRREVDEDAGTRTAHARGTVRAQQIEMASDLGKASAGDRF